MVAALTRLDLAKRLARWSGTMPPSEVTSTETPPTDQVGDLVAFVDQAWIDIQIANENRWNWMQNRLEDTAALTSGTRTLAMSVINAECREIRPFIAHDYSPLRYILLKTPVTDSVNRCEFQTYEVFRGYRDRGSRPTGKPTRFTVRKDGVAEFDPTPDDAYTLNLDWVSEPQELALDADTPNMPASFHMLVVWWAMVHLMDHDENQGRYQTADRQYKKMLNRLAIQQLPEDLHDEFLTTSEIYGW